MLLLKTIVNGYFYAGLAFSVVVSACPGYSDLQYYQPLNGSNTTDAELAKRWYTVQPGGDGNSYNPGIWPESTIPFCFADQNSRTQLAKLVKSAWKIWQAAGVNYRIDMGEYNACPPAINGLVPLDPKYLRIRANNVGHLFTTVGHQIYSAGLGPSMDFDPSPTRAMRDPLANMVHEIGHAWGFYHEQQRPSFWDKTQYAQATGSSNQIIFTCSNLADYATNGIPLDGTINDACHSAITAKGRGFSASQYLPSQENFSEQLDTGDYDWESVMLYTSKIGGMVNNGIPTDVWVKNDGKGTVVEYNKTPSQKDVERFMVMYSQDAPYKNPCLINQGCNPFMANYFNHKSGCKKPS